MIVPIVIMGPWFCDFARQILWFLNHILTPLFTYKLLMTIMIIPNYFLLSDCCPLNFSTKKQFSHCQNFVLLFWYLPVWYHVSCQYHSTQLFFTCLFREEFFIPFIILLDENHSTGQVWVHWVSEFAEEKRCGAERNDQNQPDLGRIYMIFIDHPWVVCMTKHIYTLKQDVGICLGATVNS